MKDRKKPRITSEEEFMARMRELADFRGLDIEPFFAPRVEPGPHSRMLHFQEAVLTTLSSFATTSPSCHTYYQACLP